MHIKTKLIHSGSKTDKQFNAINTPIFQSSSYVKIDLNQDQDFIYSRIDNPTLKSLEQALATIEGSKFAISYASGMAAIDALFSSLAIGDEVICSSNVYGGTHRILSNIFKDYLKIHFVDFSDEKVLLSKINKNTKLLHIETPSNPLFKLLDIEKISKIAKAHNILLSVDNSLATPYLQKPLDFGADLVVYSMTKYLSGHSDIIMGSITCNDETLFNSLKNSRNIRGNIPAPMDCFLMLRSLKTLALRLDAHSANALAVTKYLSTHHKVAKVYFPCLADGENFEIAKKQLGLKWGIVSFEFKPEFTANIAKFFNQFRIFTLAEGLAGVGSMAGYPLKMSHYGLDEDTRAMMGISAQLVRLSIGCEYIEDILEDLKRAFANV